ncbi:hypothetical protein ABPG72_020028 [Tetrahymena utriculariae]
MNKQQHLLTEVIKYAIIYDKKQGKKNIEVIKSIEEHHERKVHSTTITNLWKRYQETGLISNQWNIGGRPKLIMSEQEEMIEQLILDDRRITLNEVIQELDMSVSKQTMNRTLNDMGFKVYQSTVKPFLSNNSKRLILEFANRHSRWTEGDWSHVLFRDESKFQLSSADGRVFIRKEPTEEFRQEFYQSKVSQEKSIMLWGAISIEGPGPLVLVEGNLDSNGYLDLFSI